MRIIKPIPAGAKTLGLFPGAFNPPTRAHRALAESALQYVEAVYWILPASYPHKAWEGATMLQRERLLLQVTSARAEFGVAETEHGLFDQIAAEVRLSYPGSKLFFVCGRDAADRVLNWDYGDPEAIDRMLQGWSLLVAPRAGEPEVAPHRLPAVQSLACTGYDEYSSTRVRELIAAKGDYSGLVDESILDVVREIYASPPLEHVSRNARSR